MMSPEEFVHRCFMQPQPSVEYPESLLAVALYEMECCRAVHTLADASKEDREWCMAVARELVKRIRSTPTEAQLRMLRGYEEGERVARIVK